MLEKGSRKHLKIWVLGIQISAWHPKGLKEGMKQSVLCVANVSARCVVDALAQYGSKLTEFRSISAQSFKLVRRINKLGVS